MKYANPLPPEGINTSATHPLKEMLLLSSGLVAAVFLAVMLLGFAADKLAHHIPFATELNMAASLKGKVPDKPGEVQTYLQMLADQLARLEQLPDDMPITVHYVADPTVNALATLGGHIIMFQGLLQKLDSENAIAMVLAHEIAHIKHRHPIQSLGRGAVISLALATIGLTAGDAGNILGQTGLLSALSFSRQQEQAADITALQALAQYYGHIDGATDLFEALLKEHAEAIPQFTFLSTHPLSQHRIQIILDLAQKEQWPEAGKLTAVPEPVLQQIVHEDEL